MTCKYCEVEATFERLLLELLDPPLRTGRQGFCYDETDREYYRGVFRESVIKAGSPYHQPLPALMTWTSECGLPDPYLCDPSWGRMWARLQELLYKEGLYWESINSAISAVYPIQKGSVSGKEEGSKEEGSL